jgi:immune inhibitor A
MKTISYIILLISILSIPNNSFGILHLKDATGGPKESLRLINPAIAQPLSLGPKQVITQRTGYKKVAVILVNFNISGKGTSGSAQMAPNDLLNINNTVNYLKNFYKEASYGKLILDFEFFFAHGSAQTLQGNEVPYLLNNSMAYYGVGDEIGDGTGIDNLLKDSIKIANSSAVTITTTGYDAVIALHAGYGNESTWNSGDIWSSFVTLSEDTYGFKDGIALPAREFAASTFGPACHEFGHMLGLPDIYSTSEGTSKVGSWCLMDMGAWLNNGETPAQPSAWCKEFLGWVTPKIVGKYADLKNMMPISESENSVYKIYLNESKEEYFLLSYVKEAQLPGEGVLIWHIDEGIIEGKTFNERLSDNSVNNYSHNTIDIVSANYNHPSRAPFGDRNNTWPGIKMTFQTPDSDSYSGRPSQIYLSHFTIKNNMASLSVSNVLMADHESINDVTPYPNPSGKGYYHPKEANGIITTFIINSAKTSESKELTIYNLAGEEVRKIHDSEINLRLDLSGNYSVVYEYDWDGKNAIGEDVAAGVYFYLFKADRDTKKGKLVIVR